MLACDVSVPSECAVLRVMPLGDSITEAESGRASYRYWLYHDLVRDGWKVDFVGSRSGVYGGAPRFADFDADHEGHWGSTTREVRQGIDGWADAARADVVLLMLGSNDGARNLAATTANLTAIIGQLRAHRPGVSVLLARVPPVGDPATGALWGDIRLLNRAISQVAERLDTPDARVVVVDQGEGFDIRRDTYDGIHPNESGERKLAARFRESFAAVAPCEMPGR
jgi:acyl-CoA thioesterase-1